jgi:WD40 repeat protein/serine/threonine protein kinase
VGSTESATLASGVQIDHFTVVRLIGRGGMGEVYLARDTRLGRKVAIKLISPDLLGAGHAVDAFLAEARTTATFNHPHIVGIYFVGEHGGAPYIALEYVEGQNLRERLETSPLSTGDCIRLVLAVAEALTEAHAHGVLHLDLKPENIVVGKDGRPRVLDFGMARLLSAEAPVPHPSAPTASEADETDPDTIDAGVRGSPRYMSPEQWRSEALSGAADVWALGVILYELLAAEHPYASAAPGMLSVDVRSADPAPSVSRRREVPEELAALVAACLAKDAAARPAAATVVERLNALLGRGRLRPGEEQLPFRGLRAFTERHADYFHGRDAEVEAFIEALRETAILPVIGLSGAGKSSFVQAGVIPRLREQSAYLVVAMRPGSDPFLTLAQRLVSSETTTPAGSALVTPDQAQVGSLEGVEDGGDSDDERGLAAQLRAAPSLLALRLLELAESRHRKVLLFLDQLEEVVTLVPDERVQQAFLEALCTAADDVSGPVRVIFTVRDDFLSRLPGGPALRAALSRVTVLRSPGPEALREILTKPLAQTGYRFEEPQLVDEIVTAVQGEPASLPLVQFALGRLWEARDPERRVLTRAAYQRIGGVVGALATHGDAVLAGLSDGELRLARDILLRMVTADGTRRVLRGNQATEGLEPGAESLLRRLTDSRLVTVRRPQGGGEAELEIAHESLIKSWGRLARWIEDSRDDLLFLGEISQAAELWQKRGERHEETWHGDALRDAQKKVARCTTQLAQSVIRFLAASHANAQAQHEREVRRRAAERAETARSAFLRGDFLQARAMVRSSLETSDTTLARALWWTLTREPVIWTFQLGIALRQVAFAPDGETVAAAGIDGAIYVFDARTRALRVLRGSRAQVFSLAFSPDSRVLAIGTFDAGQVVFLDLESEEIVVRKVGAYYAVVAFSADGARLASSDASGQIILWDTATHEEVRRFQYDGMVGGLAFTHGDARLIAAGEHGRICCYDLGGTAPPRTFVAQSGTIRALAVDADERWVATGATDGTVRVHRLETGELRRELRCDTIINSLSFSPDGEKLAVGDRNIVRVLGSETFDELWRLEGIGSPGSCMFSPSGPYLVAGIGGKVHLCDLRVSLARPPVGPHVAGVEDVVFSRDGKSLFSCSDDGSVRQWDVQSGKVTNVLRSGSGGLYQVSLDPAGERLAVANVEGHVSVYDLDGRHELRRFQAGVGILSVAFDPGGQLVAAGCRDGVVRIWDMASGELVTRLAATPNDVRFVIFTRDGRYLLATSASEPVIKIWDHARGIVARELVGHRVGVISLAVSADERRLASCGIGDVCIRLWDMASGEGKVMDKTEGQFKTFYKVAWHPTDQRLLASTHGAYENAALRRLDDPAIILLPGHGGQVNACPFSPDGTLVATGADDGTVRLWRAPDGAPVWRAPLAQRHSLVAFSHRGWRRLDRDEIEARPRTQWALGVEERARRAAEAPDGSSIAIATHDDSIELWQLAEDRCLLSAAAPGLRQVLAFPSWAFGLAAGELRLHRPNAEPELVAEGISAVSYENNEILALSEKRLQLFSSEGKPLSAQGVPAGVSAALRHGQLLVLGFDNGFIEVRSPAGQTTVTCESPPASDVVLLRAGPMQTIIGGFANGSVGIWDLTAGAQLHLEKLHGPIAHLLLADNVLYAVSELGDSRSIDLGGFGRSYPALLADVQQQTPVRWEAGQLVLASGSSRPPDTGELPSGR